MSTKEVWKQIPNYENFYEASNLGNIRSIPRNGTIKTIRVLRVETTRQGRLQVMLRKKGIKKRFRIHQLIAQTFIPNSNNKPHINHIDGNPKNNKLENLEWCTQKENTTHAINKGLTARGERNSHAKLTKEKVLEIRYMWERRGAPHYYRQKEIAEVFGITQAQVSTIVRKKQWKHI